MRNIFAAHPFAHPQTPSTTSGYLIRQPILDAANELAKTLGLAALPKHTKETAFCSWIRGLSEWFSSQPAPSKEHGRLGAVGAPRDVVAIATEGLEKAWGETQEAEKAAAGWRAHADTWRVAYDSLADAAGALDGETLERTVTRIRELREQSLAQIRSTPSAASSAKAPRHERVAAALDAAGQIATLASQRAKEREISVAQATREIVDEREDLSEPYVSARDRAGHR